MWDGNYYYYFFDLSGSVVYIESEPQTQGAPASPKNRGTYGFNKAGELVVKWNAVGSPGPAIETFYNAHQGATQRDLESPFAAGCN